jgi:hypothetical protein
MMIYVHLSCSFVSGKHFFKTIPLNTTFFKDDNPCKCCREMPVCCVRILRCKAYLCVPLFCEVNIFYSMEGIVQLIETVSAAVYKRRDKWSHV